jgi:hypothetical protein
MSVPTSNRVFQRTVYIRNGAVVAFRIVWTFRDGEQAEVNFVVDAAELAAELEALPSEFAGTPHQPAGPPPGTDDELYDA